MGVHESLRERLGIEKEDSNFGKGKKYTERHKYNTIIVDPIPLTNPTQVDAKVKEYKKRKEKTYKMELSKLLLIATASATITTLIHLVFIYKML